MINLKKMTEKQKIMILDTLEANQCPDCGEMVIWIEKTAESVKCRQCDKIWDIEAIRESLNL